MISVKNLYKSFGSHQVLNDINEHIAPGEKIVIIGPSGSGKSTFLRCMNLLERPTSGQIIFDGIDITDPKQTLIKCVSIWEWYFSISTFSHIRRSWKILHLHRYV